MAPGSWPCALSQSCLTLQCVRRADLVTCMTGSRHPTTMYFTQGCVFSRVLHPHSRVYLTEHYGRSHSRIAPFFSRLAQSVRPRTVSPGRSHRPVASHSQSGSLASPSRIAQSHRPVASPSLPFLQSPRTVSRGVASLGRGVASPLSSRHSRISL
jgi:hypothetical protein